MIAKRRSGIGTRVINFLVDIILSALISYGIYYFFKWYAVYWRWPFVQYYVFFFGIQFIYYFLFESITGRSPGKMLTYSKVITKEGGKPGLPAVFIRSVIRLTIIEAFLFPVLEDRTLHDYLSGTYVVETE